jgi:glycerol-3-phosphate acyltransferase PlsY
MLAFDHGGDRSRLLRPLLVIIIAYLLGSIPFGYLIVRRRVGDDIRQSGSGGTGATNVSRRAGKAAGALTLVLDALKGSAAIIIAHGLLRNAASPAMFGWLIAAAAIATIAGHIFPVWLGFRGGKGVATGVGVFLVMTPVAVLCAGVVFLVVVLLTRYVSLGSIIAALTIPLFVWLQSLWAGPDLSVLAAAIAGALLIVFAHRANIGRLVNGTESKFGR